MELSTVVGIIFAIVVMILGLRMILRRSAPAEPSLDSALHINEESNKPIIPRHVRDQLPATPKVIARKEPELNVEAKTLDQIELNEAKSSQGNSSHTKPEQAKADQKAQTEIEQEIQVAPLVIQVIEQPADHAVLERKPQSVVNTEQSAKPDQTVAVDSLSNPEPPPSHQQATSLSQEAIEPKQQPEQEPEHAAEFEPNTQIETAKIEEFEGHSQLLDIHLHEQQQVDDESALATAQEIVALNVYPNPRRALSGDKTLKVLLKYGLRYGELSCFHRYEKTEETSPLMFSVLRITDQGPAGFDLENLSSEQVQGLAFFLALPHQHALTGYDMMTSIAGLIAREIDGTVFDENNHEFTPQLKEHWRHHVIDYCANHAAE